LEYVPKAEMIKHKMPFLAAAVFFGCIIGFCVASIDRSYNLSVNFSPETRLFLIPPLILTMKELDLSLFYWIEMVGSGFFGLLTGLAAINWSGKKKIVSVLLVMLFGISKGAINFALAYEYKIARLDLGRINDVSGEWRILILITVLHFAAGCLLCCLSIFTWKYWLAKKLKINPVI
jgi:hypothetical protein